MMFLSYDMYYLLQIEPLIFPTTTQLPSLSLLICPPTYSIKAMGKLSPAPAVHLTISRKQTQACDDKGKPEKKKQKSFCPHSLDKTAGQLGG